MAIRFLVSTTIRMTHCEVARYLLNHNCEERVLHRLIEYIQEEGLQSIRLVEEQADAVALSGDGAERAAMWKSALEIARIRIPALSLGPIELSLNWVVDETIGETIYMHALSYAFEEGGSIHITKAEFIKHCVDALTHYGSRRCSEDWLDYADSIPEETFETSWEQFQKCELMEFVKSNQI